MPAEAFYPPPIQCMIHWVRGTSVTGGQAIATTTHHHGKQERQQQPSWVVQPSSREYNASMADLEKHTHRPGECPHTPLLGVWPSDKD